MPRHFHLFLFDMVYRQVAPWKSGSREPFYFFLTPSYWRGYTDVDNNTEGHSLSTKSKTASDSVEPLERTVRKSVYVDGLTKKFGDFTAVIILSIELAENNITALLGHNGAGKTTTIKMLTGMERPSSGVGRVGGLDICRQMIDIRRSLGVCPQLDI